MCLFGGNASHQIDRHMCCLAGLSRRSTEPLLLSLSTKMILSMKQSSDVCVWVFGTEAKGTFSTSL